MRPLFMDFGTDAEAYAVHDQYFFGPSLMVCPVYTYGARSREVYFPVGRTWYDLYTGRVAADTRSGVSQRRVAPAPYARIPLYVPSGSLLAVGPAVQYTGERPQDDLTLYVYAGSDGHITLYDDDGETYGYERGAYTQIPLVYEDATRTLRIGARQGAYPGMPERLTLRIVFVSPETPVGVGEAPRVRVVCYDGRAQEVVWPSL
jgi:alpha-D-xyloside xylohydrolase